MADKTLKQIAEELNIPKQRLYRFVTSNHINESHQEGKTKWYDDAAQERIKANFFHNESHQHDASESHQTASDSYQYDAIIKTLTEQLQAKDEQIRQLQKLLDQEQQLRMVEGRMLTMSESDHTEKKWWQFWK